MSFGFQGSECQGWHVVGQLLGWEAGSDLIALFCVCVDMSVAPQEDAVCTQRWGGCSMYGASARGGHRQQA